MLPEWQGRGLGVALVNAMLVELRKLGAAGCVVPGEPAYYARFGFRQEERLVLSGVPPRYFQAMELRGVVPCGEVTYHPSFAAGA